MKYAFLTGLLVILAGCTSTPQASAPEAAAPASSLIASPETTSSPAEPSVVANAPSPISEAEAVDRTISAQGIGAARLGMTLAELKQSLPDAQFTVEAPFMVDFDAIAVSQAGEKQFYILYMAGQQFQDSDVIQGLLTDNLNYKTAEGIGAETPIQQAEDAYGKATLSYNTDNEGREYARFERQPSQNLSFATGNGNVETAGIYPSSTSSFNETQQFRDDAKIQSILVVCLAEQCTQ